MWIPEMVEMTDLHSEIKFLKIKFLKIAPILIIKSLHYLRRKIKFSYVFFMFTTIWEIP